MVVRSQSSMYKTTKMHEGPLLYSCEPQISPALNRAQVFVDPLTPGDLLYIAANKFPALVEAGAATDGTDCANQDGLHSPQAGVLPPVLGNDSLLARMISFNRYGRT